MSKLFFVNFIFIQWFFIRICCYVNDEGIKDGYGILFPVVPLTGWWSSSYIPKSQKNIRICSVKKK